MDLDELIMLSAAALMRGDQHPSDYREAVRKAKELWKVFRQMEDEEK